MIQWAFCYDYRSEVRRHRQCLSSSNIRLLIEKKKRLNKNNAPWFHISDADWKWNEKWREGSLTFQGEKVHFLRWSQGSIVCRYRWVSSFHSYEQMAIWSEHKYVIRNALHHLPSLHSNGYPFILLQHILINTYLCCLMHQWSIIMIENEVFPLILCQGRTSAISSIFARSFLNMKCHCQWISQSNRQKIDRWQVFKTDVAHWIFFQLFLFRNDY